MPGIITAYSVYTKNISLKFQAIVWENCKNILGAPSTVSSAFHLINLKSRQNYWILVLTTSCFYHVCCEHVNVSVLWAVRDPGTATGVWVCDCGLRCCFLQIFLRLNTASWDVVLRTFRRSCSSSCRIYATLRFFTLGLNSALTLYWLTHIALHIVQGGPKKYATTKWSKNRIKSCQSLLLFNV